MKDGFGHGAPLRISLVVIVALLAIVGSLWIPAAAETGPITPLNPAEQALTSDQLVAQATALASSQVQNLTNGHRAEVFEVFPLSGPYDSSYSACTDGTCYQVDIYNFDTNATVTAIVHVAQSQVLDVYHLPNMQPLVNKRLYNRAVELIRSSADVEAALGFVPEANQIRLMALGRQETACDVHLCGGATFFTDSGTVWVLVDLTADKIEQIWWSERPQELKTALYNPKSEKAPEDCNITIHVNRDGWNLDYRTTPTDALEITSVTYDVNGTPRTVATRMKLVEWHAHYPGNWGYQDYTGCGGGGGGFPIYPYGNTQVRNLLDHNNNYAGFEVVQDFRMGNWGTHCNYRYEQHFKFYLDGSFRVVAGAFGQGCGNDQDQEATYRPVMRIDIAADGDPNDSLAVWNGTQWTTQNTEAWWLQSGPYTPEGYRYRVTDENSGFGYYIEPGQGQFDDAGTGDRAYTYVTLQKPAEGDGDLPKFGGATTNYCCFADQRQGPDTFLNSEAVNNQNIVLWYVPQSTTITTWQHNQPPYPTQYCWTDNTSSTWPCFVGPLFVPTSNIACSPLDFDCDYTVDANDITAVATHWNCIDGQSACYESQFDLDQSGAIDIKDVLTDASHWGCALGQACYRP